ncbi:MAG: hypothetical protein ACXW4E_00010 [Anaerolineales bacterium]
MARKKATTPKERTDQKPKMRNCGLDFNSNDARNPASDHKMPWFGWLGLAIMILSEILLWTGNHPVAVAFTPVMWTGYILLVDGWIWARGGRSYFKDDKLEWPMLALFSILIWVMFEMFNLSAWAWSYSNRPPNRFVEAIVFAWAFATIIPALLRTRSLFATFHFFDHTHPWKKFKFTPFWQAVSFVVGIGLTFIPVMFDGCTQATMNNCTPNILVWMVWLGFIFMIEPINYRLGAPSVFCHIEEGKTSFLWQVLFAGLFCGLLWETWNIQAAQPQFLGLTWNYHLNDIYLIPNPENYWHIGKMPILGFLGYPPFIWECFALWELCRWALQGDYLWKGSKG